MILEAVPAPRPRELTGHPVSNQATRHYAGTWVNHDTVQSSSGARMIRQPGDHLSAYRLRLGP
jgi:hypothetical protein